MMRLMDLGKRFNMDKHKYYNELVKLREQKKNDINMNLVYSDVNCDKCIAKLLEGGLHNESNR